MRVAVPTLMLVQKEMELLIRHNSITGTRPPVNLTCIHDTQWSHLLPDTPTAWYATIVCEVAAVGTVSMGAGAL